jgi:uridine monophosphate synthetase
MRFFEKLNEAIARNQSLLIIPLDPNPENIIRYIEENKDSNKWIDELWDWLQFLIIQTSDLVCAYKPTLGFYEAFGAVGIKLLSQVLEAVPKHIPVILDAKHGDLNTSTIVAQTIFQSWQVDAVTISPYTGQDQVTPFLLYPDKAVFILCRSSNPKAVNLQEYPFSDSPFYLHLVKEVKTWGTPEQVCLEVGTSDAEILRKIRNIAPERIILARSIWGEGSNLDQILTAGLDCNGEGLLIPTPIEFLSSQQPAQLIQDLKQEVNQIRSKIVNSASSCQVWIPNILISQQHPHQDLILQLYDIGCLLFGDFVQASGEIFSYYIDLRKIISNPQIFHQVLQAYANILKNLTFDRLAGIPYGSLPTATGLALKLNCPMIFPRKEVKAHGTRRLIEGHFQPGEKVVVIDDILITGNSAIEGAEKLKFSGLEVEDIVVLIDHEKGVKDKLKANGYSAYSVLTITEIADTLYRSSRIDREQFCCFKESLP